MRVRRLYLLIGAITLLVVVSAVGFFLYNYFFVTKNTPAPVDNAQLQIKDLREAFYNIKQDPEDPPITPFRDLNEKILMLPQSTASAQEKKDYIAFVSKYASAQNTVDLKDCAPKPLVVWVKSGSEITLKNADSDTREISVNDQHSVSVPANSSAKIKADFGQGPGVYAYSCDDSDGPVGLFLVASD